MGVYTLAPAGADFHCTPVEPVAAAVKVADEPAAAVCGVGCVVTVGGEFTVTVATLVVALPRPFVNTASYWVPLSPSVMAGVV